MVRLMGLVIAFGYLAGQIIKTITPDMKMALWTFGGFALGVFVRHILFLVYPDKGKE